MTYITIDGGTTNTRVYVVADGEIRETARLSIGAKDGKAALIPALREVLAAMLEKYPATHRVIASGMITSERGLYELPHISAPRALRNCIRE